MFLSQYFKYLILFQFFTTVTLNSFSQYEAILPEDIFFRIHNSHLINLNYVKKYNRGRGGFVELDDGSTIEVATRRRDEFLKRFGFE